MSSRVRLVITDIDGTITRRRGDTLLSVHAMEAIRILESHGIVVSLASGNSLPVTVGVARYIGATGPVIAENGCVVFDQGSMETIHICEGRPPEELVRELASLGLTPSWQNPYRLHDVAFHDPHRETRLRMLVESIVAKYSGFKVIASGYAYHIAPVNASKAQGALVALRLLGLDRDSVLGVGDGENDLPLFDVVGYSAAPADADPMVRERVDYVASKPGGEGFAEITRMVLEGVIP